MTVSDCEVSMINSFINLNQNFQQRLISRCRDY
jgi:hypothetical protein